jgi:hypothetical protein
MKVPVTSESAATTSCGMQFQIVLDTSLDRQLIIISSNYIFNDVVLASKSNSKLGLKLHIQSQLFSIPIKVLLTLGSGVQEDLISLIE